jgi:hypothetical protein
MGFPQTPFYIMSMLSAGGRSDWVLAIDPPPAEQTAMNVGMHARQGSIFEMWRAEPFEAGGAALINVGSGLALTLPAAAGWPLTASPQTDGGNPTQRWVNAPKDGGYGVLTTVGLWPGSVVDVNESDVSGVVRIFGDDGGANQKWLMTPDAGGITYKDIVYETANGTKEILDPVVCDALSVDATASATAVTSTLQLQSSYTESRSITNSRTDTTSTEFGESLTAKGGFDDIVEVSSTYSLKVTTSKSVSFSDQTTNSTTTTNTLTVQVTAEPGQKVTAQVRINRGRCTVPYTAIMVFQSSVKGAAPVEFPISGIFTGINAMSQDIVKTDLTDPANPKDITDPTETQALA